MKVAWGYGFSLQPPQWTAIDSPIILGGPALVPGSYDMAVTTRTPWGETMAVPQTIETVNGRIALTVTPTLGAWRYGVYIRPQFTGQGDGPPLELVAEVETTKFDASPLSTTITSLIPQNVMYPETLPIRDTSAHEFPDAVVAATRLLAIDTIREDQNMANAGIIGDGTTKFATTQGSAPGAHSAFWLRAEQLLATFESANVYST